MNWVLAAYLSCSSHDISTIRHLSASQMERKSATREWFVMRTRSYTKGRPPQPSPPESGPNIGWVHLVEGFERCLVPWVELPRSERSYRRWCNGSRTPSRVPKYLFVCFLCLWPLRDAVLSDADHLTLQCRTNNAFSTAQRWTGGGGGGVNRTRSAT